MGIVCTAPKCIASLAEEASRRLSHQITIRLQRLGFECETRAKEKANFKDQTGNLRSSIGSAVYDHGRKVMESMFETKAGKKGDGKEGTDKGRQYVASLAQLYANTYALVVVAGMDYAEYVEGKGKDVLASTELYARAEIEKVLKQARMEAERQINNLL